MTVEMIESLPKVPEGVLEINSLEPMAVFLVKNGTGGEREMTVTLSSWKSAVNSAIEEREKIKEGQGRVKERARTVSKRKTAGAGRPYSSTEKRQILSQIEKDREKIDLEVAVNCRRRTVLVRQSNWLLVSPPECPLKVRINGEGSDDVIAGEPLNKGEAAWRMFVFQEGKNLAHHPNVRIVKEFFVLRRNVFFRIEDKPGEAVKKLDELRSKILDYVPDELVPVFRKINEFDFRKPLLPELEILRRES